MAQINRYSRRTPYEGSLYQLPVELIASTLEQTQKRFDQNKDIADQIRDFSIPALPQDRERANQLQKQYTTQVDELVKQYSGNYAKASSQLKDLTRKIKRDFNPGGEANAISGNYNNYNTWLKSSQELVEKGKALGADFNLANKYEMGRYQGVGEFNPVTGAYNIFNPETLSEYADMEANIQKSFATFKPEKRKVVRTKFENGKIVKYEEETDGVTSDRLKPSFQQVLATDPKISTYYMQKAKYLGLGADQTKAYIDNYATQRAHDLAYMNTVDSETAVRDPLSLLYARHKLAEDAKKKEVEQLRNLWTTSPSVGLPFRKQSEINPDNWRETIGVSGPSPETNSVSGMQSNSNFANWLSVGLESSTKGKPLLDVLFTKDFINKTKIDPTVAKAVWSSLSSKNPKAYVDNYLTNKNQAWSEQFESQFLHAYQAAEKNHKFVAPALWDIPQVEARTRIVKGIVDKLAMDPSKLTVMAIGSGEIMTAQEAEITPKDFMYDMNDKQVLTSDVRIAAPGPGVAGTGHMVTTKKGQYIFLDDYESRNAASAPLTHAANNLFFEGKEITDAPIDMVFQGQAYNGYMGRTVVADRNGMTHEILHAIPVLLGKDKKPILDSKGNLQPMPKNKYNPADYIVDWRDTQNAYLRESIQGLSGMGQTKSAGTFFDMYLGQQAQGQYDQDMNNILDEAAINQQDN